MPRLLGLCALLTVALTATASAAPKTHVFRMDINVNVSTTWDSHSENRPCSDLNRVLDGEGSQHIHMEVKNRLVTLRGGKLAYPGTRGVQRFGRLGTFMPLHGRVQRLAKYTLNPIGGYGSCAPGWGENDHPPSTRTCGMRPAKGGLYGLVPSGASLRLTALTLLDDPFEGECPAESNAAIALPQPIEITHGKDAMRQLADPRVKKVFVQGMTDDIETQDPWGSGEVHWGNQTSDVLWYAKFRRVG